VGFVATKKMKLLSGNPDGFVFDFELQNPTEECHRLNICGTLCQEARLSLFDLPGWLL
jgi:hypothetical protein